MRKDARRRSRLLAAPIVLTIGAAAGCGATPAEPPHGNPPPPAPELTHGNPPPPPSVAVPSTGEPIHVNPPPPKRAP